MISQAERHLRAAQTEADSALKSLNQIVVHECPGSDYRPDVLLQLEQAHSMLLRVRKLLRYEM